MYMDGKVSLENLHVISINRKIVPYNKNKLLKLNKCFSQEISIVILTALRRGIIYYLKEFL